MTIFDKLVDEAIQNRQDLAVLRTVVEKELLHHDILRILSEKNFLTHLTFIGGTCLRLCYGADRLSEDLDFTGGADFTKNTLSHLSEMLIESLNTKYELPVEVTSPKREEGNVATWKLKIITRPKNKHIPSQRINIDICAISSYQAKPMMLQNPYNVDMGTNGLIIRAESREEIFTDKIIAFALRHGRIKNRDLWDMLWLHQKGVRPLFELIQAKLNDHKCTTHHFIKLLNERRQTLTSQEIAHTFQTEMHRFLPINTVANTITHPAFWELLTNFIDELCKEVLTTLPKLV